MSLKVSRTDFCQFTKTLGNNCCPLIASLAESMCSHTFESALNIAKLFEKIAMKQVRKGLEELRKTQSARKVLYDEQVWQQDVETTIKSTMQVYSAKHSINGGVHSIDICFHDGTALFITQKMETPTPSAYDEISISVTGHGVASDYLPRAATTQEVS